MPCHPHPPNLFCKELFEEVWKTYLKTCFKPNKTFLSQYIPTPPHGAPSEILLGRCGDDPDLLRWSPYQHIISIHIISYHIISYHIIYCIIIYHILYIAGCWFKSFLISIQFGMINTNLTTTFVIGEANHQRATSSSLCDALKNCVLTKAWTPVSSKSTEQKTALLLSTNWLISWSDPNKM